MQPVFDTRIRRKFKQEMNRSIILILFDVSEYAEIFRIPIDLERRPELKVVWSNTKGLPSCLVALLMLPIRVQAIGRVKNFASLEVCYLCGRQKCILFELTNQR